MPLLRPDHKFHHTYKGVIAPRVRDRIKVVGRLDWLD